MRVTPSAAGNRREDIQGLRAVAVLMVVAFHAGLPVPGGFVGVDVFFVISGFVITAMLLREWASTGRIRLGRFYARRFKRLTPALAVTVGVVMLASLLWLSPFGSQQIAAQTAVGAMLLGANVVIARSTGDYFDAPAEANPLLNTWSLSVEEQFYLVFPAILLASWLVGRRSRKPLIVPVFVVLGVGALSLALAWLGSAGVDLAWLPETLVGFYGPATRVWEFALGALLALGADRLKIASPAIAMSLSVVGILMLTASLWLVTGATPFPGPWTLLPTMGTLLLIAAGSNDTIVSRTLGSRPMVALGDGSYSIYLWHWPVIVFAKMLYPGSAVVPLAAAVLSLLPAYASYRWVEQPIRALPHESGSPLARLVAATVLPALVLAGALGFGARNGFWLDSVKEHQATMKPTYASRLAGCHAPVPMGERQPGECTWNSTAPGKPIYLVGDSNADHFSDGIILAAEALDRPVFSSTASACPFVDVPLLNTAKSDAQNENCRAYVSATLEHLLVSTPGTVIISATDSYWGDTIHRVGTAMDANEKTRAFETGLTSTAGALERAGHAVILVQAIPRWEGEDTLVDCSLLSILSENVGCSQEMPVLRALERQRSVREAVVRATQGSGATLLDPWDVLCSDVTCTSTDGDLLRYRDATHITVAQSKLLAPWFEAGIPSAG